MRSALTIAASDPSGGAGVQADLKAFSYVGVHGCSVITCLTAQNTRKVSEIYEVPLKIIEAQLDVILEDIKISTCKTGMLYSPGIVNLIAKKSEEFDFPLVVDPVMKASVGNDLHKKGFVESMKTALIPKATIVIPNIPEAEVISGQKIKSIEDMKEAAKKIHTLGCRYVLIKGGHLAEKKATDILFDGKDYRLYFGKSYPKDLHGTGCVFSALITALLAMDKTIKDAVEEAKIHMCNIIEYGYEIGKGHGMANIMAETSYSEDELKVIKALAQSVLELVNILPVSLIPEVGINFGYALKNAKTSEDVCALEGRIVKVGEKIGHLGGFRFGISKHVARMILTVMKHDPNMRSAMNIKYDEEILDAFSSQGFSIASFDRSEEPKDTSTMKWGTEQAITQQGKVPDIIYDAGALGKEPMIRILGKSPEDVVKKLKPIIK